MIVNPELGLVRAGVVVQSPEGNYIIGGGGQNTESIYPAFVYHFSENGQSLEVATPEKWPVYIHSATVYADSLNQPVLVFKGGGNYPFMTNHLSSYRIKMPNPGKFVRIFDTGKVKSFSKVTLTYTSPQKEKKDIVIKVKTPDSRGYNAMQEWLWIPEGGQIEDIRYESKDVIVIESEVTPSKNDSNKKRKRINSFGL